MPFRPNLRYPDDETAARFGRELLEVLDSRSIEPGGEFAVGAPGTAQMPALTAEMIQKGAMALLDAKDWPLVAADREDYAFWSARKVLEAVLG